MESTKTQIVYHGNAFDVTGREGTVLITDPPYREHVHKSAVSQAPVKGVRVRDLGFTHLTPALRSHVAKVAANVKRWSVIYSDVESLSWWRIACQAAGATYIRPIPWVRWSMPQLSGDRPPSGCEFTSLFWGSQKGKKTWNGPGNLTHWDHKCLRGEGKHKAEKALDQLLDIVEYATDEDDTVIDLFAGSGTTGLACKILGRSFIGIELDGEWVDKANARIAAVDVDDGGISGLSERDMERCQRYFAAKKVRDAEAARIDANTARVRARADTEVAKRAAEGTRAPGSGDCVFCEHANENPSFCWCPSWCYCQTRTCASRTKAS